MEPRKDEANPLTRKLSKILNGGDGGRGAPSEDVVEALRGLSLFFKKNTKRARTNLRGDLEKKTLTVSEEFLTAFETVHKKLDAVHSDIQALSRGCADMNERLQAARADTRQLIQQTSSLQQEARALNVQGEVLDMFLDQFMLKEEERKALVASGRDLTDEFFAAFERARKIHEDCKLLLRTNQQRAGLSIMESMSALQEVAYERLYRWTQTACRGLSADLPEHPALLCRAFHVLRARPVLLQYCLTELGTARRNSVSRAFIEALTRGGPAGVPKPIELFSHDAERYTSDMLAWLHQCVASERELLCFLLSPPTEAQGRRRFGDTRLLSEEDNARVVATLDQAMEAACRPLKVRVDQVLSTDVDLVTLFKIAGVLQFYFTTISGLAGETASLSALVAELRSNALKSCFDALSIHANTLLAKVEFPPADLSPPLALGASLDTLRQILSTQDAAVSAHEVHRAELAKVLSCVLDPLLSMCALCSSKLAPAEVAVFMLNCIDRIQSCLALFDFTEAKSQQLSQQCTEHLQMLVGEQSQHLLRRCGLAETFAVLQAWQAMPPSKPPLSSMPGLDAASLSAALGRLDECVASLGHTQASPQCDLLLSTRHRQTVLRGAVDSLLHLYTTLYTQLGGPTGPLARRPPEQLATLMQ
eukprot:m.238701 g.238701  ORF g.238701 m.238701 type:complete len:648 (+) comp21943_c0_seq1:104-2047(+)